MASSHPNRVLAKAPLVCCDCGSEAERKSNRQLRCIACQRAKKQADDRARHQRDRADHIAKMRIYRQRTLEIRRAQERRYYAEGRRRKPERTPEQQRRYNQTQYWKDPVSSRMSTAVKRGLRSGKAGARWTEILPYSPQELRSHLERQFLPGMSWENMGKWHIDHIIPLASFKFEHWSDPDFQAAWSLTNLRPLWAVDNQKKHSRRDLLL